jgi:hypothetical protein
VLLGEMVRSYVRRKRFEAKILAVELAPLLGIPLIASGGAPQGAGFNPDPRTSDVFLAKMGVNVVSQTG